MGAPLFFLILIGIPITEIAIYIQVGKAIGVPLTILLTVMTSVIGVLLVRQQSVQGALKVYENLNRGELPVQEMFANACIILGGILLIIPGFFTDFLGLLLFLSPVQNWLRGVVERRGSIDVSFRGPGGSGTGQRNGTRPTGPVIDGDFIEVDPDQDRPPSTGKKKDASNPWAHLNDTVAESGEESSPPPPAPEADPRSAAKKSTKKSHAPDTGTPENGPGKEKPGPRDKADR